MECYAFVRSCAECADNRIKLLRNAGPIWLLHGTETMEVVPIDKQTELIRNLPSLRYIGVLKNHFTKLFKAIQMKSVFASKVANLLIENWLFKYSTQTELLSDNATQSKSIFFIEVRRILKTKNEFTATWNMKTKGHVERLNRTIIASLRSCINVHQRE